MSAKKKPVKITDALCEAWSEFARDSDQSHGTYPDKDVRGWRRRVGKLRSTWEYYRQYRRAGDVVTLREVIGHFPEMKTLTARKEADLIAGKTAGGTPKRSPSRSGWPAQPS